MTTEDRVTDGVPYQTGYAYDPATGDLSGMTYPSGLTLDFQYDANGRVSGISSGGQTLVGNVAYKPFGPVKSMDLGPLALTRTYDQRYQVTGIQAGTVLNYGYAHDGAGNVETISGLPNPDFFPRLTDLTYTANRMATQNTDFISGIPIYSPAAVYSHDAAGNIVSDGLHTDYFYNQNNRLIRVEIDGFTVAEYAYDGFERRVKKIVNGVTTHFHYDLNGLLISETDGNGNPRKDYVYLDGEPVAMKVYGGSAGWYWFVNDYLGTPQKMVDAAGTVVWAAAYAPFGEARVYEDEVTNNLRFPGQYYDVETGLHYNWHRYYDPETGRYLTPDPIGLAGGLNLYAYVSNNPATFFDPYGLFTASDIASSWQSSANAASSDLDQMVSDSPGLWAAAATFQTLMDVGGGYVDLLRFGEGAAEGGFCGYGKDVLRGVGLTGFMAGGTKAFKGLGGVDPGKLRLPPSRASGADPFKLADQMKKFGNSTKGMQPLQVTKGARGELMINDGVTRATRVELYNQLNKTHKKVGIQIIEKTNHDFGHLPTVRRSLGGP